MGSFFRQLSCYDLWLSVSLCLLATVSTARGQTIPDGTLPRNSLVTSNGNTVAIEEGTRVGSNLFHSFQEFSVPTGVNAFFNNASDVQNILSRVTGGNISYIDGLIRANGTANLFLINPNGIIFGQNAQLNIGGSLIGSTASSIKFASGSEFSATNPQAPPLLTINVPVGLQFGLSPGSIINQSQATTIFSKVGLQVPPGQTLALIGGDLILDSGNLTAFSGEIHLGSVASPGLVSFTPTATGLAFDYTNITNFGNIELSGTASVNASGLGGGAIRVVGGNITLRDRSNLRSDTVGTIDGRGIDIQATQFKLQDLAFVSSNTAGTGAGGGITIRATDAVELQGIGFDNFQTYVDAALKGTLNLLDIESGLFTGTVGAGTSGNITIDTPQLTLREGAIIVSPTFGAGAGGNVAIKATEVVDVSGSGVLTTAFAQGNAGTLTIDTGKLIIRDEASVTTATFFGSGNSGDITVRAAESITLSEFKEVSTFGTNLSTTTIGGTGNAGNIEISTGSLLLEGGATITSASGATPLSGIITSAGRGGNITINAFDSVTVIGTSDGNPPSRSQIATATLGSADSGDLTINTKALIIQDGGGVGASTVDAGRGGDVFINASESVEVIGRTRNGASPSGLATASGDLLLASFFPGQLNPTGAAGDLFVTTGRLLVGDGASVNVGSVGTGDAGSINVVADAIALDKGGSINASTVSGSGGNINLQTQDILLRQGSLISTNAGNTQGGNITINTDTLVAVPWENSDITANAQTGSGGRVSVTAQGIFGTEFRDRLTPESDITATSDLGPQFNGTVQIDIRGIDPSQGLVELPETVVDNSDRIATGCPANEGNSFAITGRGGLPENPTGTLRGRSVWQDLRFASSTTGTEEQDTLPKPQPLEQNQQPTTNDQQPSPLAEAKGWVINTDGQVELVTLASEVTSQPPLPHPANCSKQG